jgi:uncharacterized alpha-E superfamily protein
VTTLLSRVAENLYWASRYLERSEDTARVVRSFTDAMADMPATVSTSWEPLIAIAGSRELYDEGHVRVEESDIVRFLVADAANPGSVCSSVSAARDDLRSTREIIPVDAWHAVNDLFLYVSSHRESGVDRRTRNRFLERVIDENRRLDGIISAGMVRDEAHAFWRLGQWLERADMTTRVLGVRAAALLDMKNDEHGPVLWMGVLRSLSAMQMYQRTVRGPIDGAAAVRFALFDAHFPRSVSFCLDRVRKSLKYMPNSGDALAALDAASGVMTRLTAVSEHSGTNGTGPVLDGRVLDAAMDEIQDALAAVHTVVAATYFET